MGQFDGHDYTTGGQLAALALRPASDFTGQTIRGSCFGCQTPFTQVFPAGVSGVIFVGCNLDNVALPPGSTLVACCNRQFAPNPAAGGAPYLVDAQGHFLTPANGGLAADEAGNLWDPTGAAAGNIATYVGDVPVIVNTAIMPAILPLVQAVEADLVKLAQDYGSLQGHTGGAFGSLGANGGEMTPPQIAAWLVGCPNLANIYSLVAQIDAALTALPKLPGDES